MTSRWRQPYVLVVLLAIASLLTTMLVVLNVAARRGGGQASGGDAASQGLPVWYALPDFALVDQRSELFTHERMRAGHVSIVNFIFTRCQGPCPMITSVMAGLQLTLQKTDAWEHVQLVSVSVDPEHDVPEVLAQYAGWSHAEPGKWFFVTGSRSDVWRLIVEGFKLPVGEADDNPLMPIFHSQKFALVDGAGRVRGMYDALEPEAREALLRDVDRLVSQESAR